MRARGEKRELLMPRMRIYSQRGMPSFVFRFRRNSDHPPPLHSKHSFRLFAKRRDDERLLCRSDRLLVTFPIDLVLAPFKSKVHANDDADVVYTETKDGNAAIPLFDLNVATVRSVPGK